MGGGVVGGPGGFRPFFGLFIVPYSLFRHYLNWPQQQTHGFHLAFSYGTAPSYAAIRTQFAHPAALKLVPSSYLVCTSRYAAHPFAYYYAIPGVLPKTSALSHGHGRVNIGNKLVVLFELKSPCT